MSGRNKCARGSLRSAYELEATLEQRKKAAELKQTQAATIKPGNAIFTQRQKPLGLGHAVWCARHWIGNEPFAVLLPDELTLDTPGCIGQLVQAHEKTGGSVVAVMEVPREQTKSYERQRQSGRAATCRRSPAWWRSPSPRKRRPILR